MANVSRVLVHDAVQNDELARSIGAHLVSRVLAHGRVLVHRRTSRESSSSSWANPSASVLCWQTWLPWL
jgi:hypothetical protein